MNVLLLTPQPFYQHRGSPMRLNNILQVLDERGDRIDVLSYFEGSDIAYRHIRLHRLPDVPLGRHIRPGFSWKKLILDPVMFVKTLGFAFRKRYRLVHALEESVYMALVLKWLFGIPYIYQMDSSVAQQMVEKYPRLGRLHTLLDAMERVAVRNAAAVIPVSTSLAESVERYGPRLSVILRDISMLEAGQEGEGDGKRDLRGELGIDGPLLMYVGNLEAYQGVDLLLESYALALKKWGKPADLVIVGGEENGIREYKEKARLLGVQGSTHFLGTRPASELGGLLAQADVLVAPRVKGKNTPMKIYSYLHSGKAVLATDLPTHTEVVEPHVAVLARPEPEAFAAGMLALMRDEALRQRLGERARALIEEKYSRRAFRETLLGLYDTVSARIAKRQGAGASQGRTGTDSPASGIGLGS